MTGAGQTVPRPADALVGLADKARLALFRALGPVARELVVAREIRVAVLGVLGVALALALTSSAPLVLLAVGPLLLGVPHLLADARYLVLRPTLHRRRALMVPAAVLLVGLLAGFGVRAGLASAVAAALVGTASLRRRLVIAAVPGVLLLLALKAPFGADVVFLHAHNLMAIGIWLAWRRRETRLHWLVLGAFIGASVLLAYAPLPSGTFGSDWTGLSFEQLGETLSLSQSADATHRWVLFFAFAQSFHYAIWLRLIPDEDRKRRTPPSFTQSLRALRQDFGSTTLSLFALVAVTLLVIAFFHVSFARDVYLGIAYAHGHIELLAAAFIASEGMRWRSA